VDGSAAAVMIVTMVMDHDGDGIDDNNSDYVEGDVGNDDVRDY
jgi:hypothetical protein